MISVLGYGCGGCNVFCRGDRQVAPGLRWFPYMNALRYATFRIIMSWLWRSFATARAACQPPLQCPEGATTIFVGATGRSPLICASFQKQNQCVASDGSATLIQPALCDFQDKTSWLWRSFHRKGGLPAAPTMPIPLIFFRIKGIQYD
jgi:hypothetical protein